MTKSRGLFTICATICMVFVLALVMGAMTHHGTAAKATGTTGKIVADGGGPPPPDDDDDVGNVRVAGASVSSDDDADMGSVRIADGGGPPPPDDDDDVGNLLVARL